MKIVKNCSWAACLVIVSLLFASPIGGEEITKSLKGKVNFLDKPNLSLEKRLELAKKESKAKEGDYFLTGYSFMSREKVNIRSDGKSQVRSYKVTLKDDEISISKPRSKEKNVSISDTEEGGEEIGVLFLTRISGKKGTITDLDVIDFDNTYEFKDPPLYWLGKVKTDESIRFYEDLFDSVDHKIQKKSILVVSLHDSPISYDFLKHIAVGDYNTKLRKNAIFWLGQVGGEDALKFFEEILLKK